MATTLHDRIEKNDALTMVMTAGNAYRARVTFTTSSGPDNLTDVTELKFAAKEQAEDATPVLEVTVNLTDPEHDLANGVIIFKVTATENENVPYGRYEWDFRMVRTGGSTPRNWPQPPQDLVVLDKIAEA